MNFFLLMYLNFIRGPQMKAAQQEKDEKDRLAKEIEDHKNGVVAPKKTCKKCDATITDSLTRYVHPTRPLCLACQVTESANEKAEADRIKHEIKMSPFLWFQLFVMFLGFAAFVHRNVIALF